MKHITPDIKQRLTHEQRKNYCDKALYGVGIGLQIARDWYEENNPVRYYDDPSMKGVLEELFGGEWAFVECVSCKTPYNFPQWVQNSSPDTVEGDRHIFPDGELVIDTTNKELKYLAPDWQAQLAFRGFYPTTMKPK